MPDQRTKFSEAWLSGKDANGDTVGDWCQKGKMNIMDTADIV